MVDYCPLLTADGIVQAYDPSAPCTPPPQRSFSTHIPYNNNKHAVSAAIDDVDVGYEGSVATYAPEKVHEVPQSVDDIAEIQQLKFFVRSPEEIKNLSSVEGDDVEHLRGRHARPRRA